MKMITAPGELVFIFTLLFFTGCTTVQPTSHDFNAEKSYTASEPTVWDAIMDFFTRNSILIKTIERDSGIVYAEQEFVGIQDPTYFESIADCGSYGLDVPGEGKISLNVFVRDNGNNDTVIVRVNTNYARDWIHKDLWTGSKIKQTRQCTSKGVLEESVFQNITEYVERIAKDD